MNLLLFIGTSEVVFILFIMVMVFGAEKIPEIARNLGKGMRAIKNATNDIKSEITRSAEKSDINLDFTEDLKKEIGEVKDEIEELTGSVRRKF
ncbi:MAG TPA: twin-arginine translocase TatA/TatE family subunit [Salinimicrobium sp.]|nr:twin-arginine translocase TatA/TatE family subunit [Salinimicrobium sp.]